MGIFNFLRGKSKKNEKSYPSGEFTSLVIYAGQSYDDNPDKSFPSFIYHNFTELLSKFSVDIAPYLTVLETDDMKNAIRKWKENVNDNNEYVIARDAEIWLNKQIANAKTHFLFELEPEDFAGDAYSRALNAEKNASK